MEKNAILAIVLSVVVLMVWNVLFIAPQQEKLREEQARQEERARQQEQVEEPSVEQPAQDIQVTTPVQGLLPSAEAQTRTANEDAEEILVDTPLLHVVLTTQGARIVSWQTLEHHDSDGNPVELVSDVARRLMQLPLEISSGNEKLDEELNTSLYRSSHASLSLQPGDEAAALTLSYVTQNGVTLRKKLTFYPDSYKVDLTLDVSDPAPFGNTLSVVWGPGLGNDLEDTLRFQSGVVAKMSDDDPEREDAKKIEGLMTYRNVQWGAMNRKYFTAALFAGTLNNVFSTNTLVLQPQEGEEELAPMQKILVGLSQPIQSGEVALSIYAGPKERVHLNRAYTGFARLIDYGFFSVIAEPLALFMTFLYGYVHNYGVVIICLTILIKIVFYPLTHKSFKSMKMMQELQPEMTKIREKYKKDQQKQQQEMMKLYKERGVNPMGGCLPMVLQIPVFIALYQTLSQSIELRGASFLWIPDLSSHEVVSFLQGTFAGDFVRPLVLMMGASMFLQQSMTPTAADNKQAQMFKFLPLIFLAMFWSFPAGLVLYWFMNNILTIGQQYLINKSSAKPSKQSKDSQEEDHTAPTSKKRRKKSK